jgi:hypothetical protein
MAVIFIIRSSLGTIFEISWNVSTPLSVYMFIVMSVRYRQAFRETLCCCLLDQPQSRRSTMEYTYIKSMNRQRSTDIPGYFKNGTLRRSYDKDDSHAGIQLLQNESNMPIR